MSKKSKQPLQSLDDTLGKIINFESNRPSRAKIEGKHLSENELTLWIAAQIESRKLALKDIPAKMARCALSKPEEMLREFSMEMQAQKEIESRRYFMKDGVSFSQTVSPDAYTLLWVVDTQTESLIDAQVHHKGKFSPLPKDQEDGLVSCMIGGAYKKFLQSSNSILRTAGELPAWATHRLDIDLSPHRNEMTPMDSSDPSIEILTPKG